MTDTKQKPLKLIVEGDRVLAEVEGQWIDVSDNPKAVAIATGHRDAQDLHRYRQSLDPNSPEAQQVEWAVEVMKKAEEGTPDSYRDTAEAIRSRNAAKIIIAHALKDGGAKDPQNVFLDPNSPQAKELDEALRSVPHWLAKDSTLTQRGGGEEAQSAINHILSVEEEWKAVAASPELGGVIPRSFFDEVQKAIGPVRSAVLETLKVMVEDPARYTGGKAKELSKTHREAVGRQIVEQAEAALQPPLTGEEWEELYTSPKAAQEGLEGILMRRLDFNKLDWGREDFVNSLLENEKIEAANSQPVSVSENDAATMLYIETVKCMIVCQKDVLRHPSDFVVHGNTLDGPKAIKKYSNDVVELLRRAKLIAIPAELYGDLHHKWDVTMEGECGLVWSPPKEPKSLAEKRVVQAQADRVMAHTERRARFAPFPRQLPFEVCYFVYGSGIPLSDLQYAAKAGVKQAKLVTNAILLGTLMSRDGWCLEFFSAVCRQRGTVGIYNTCHRAPPRAGEAQEMALEFGIDPANYEGRWLGGVGGPWDLLPFIATELVDHVNACVELDPSVFDKKARQEWRRKRKKLGVSKGEKPPPFYHYKLRASLPSPPSDDDEGEGGVGIKRTYRTDVRAHERLLVRRGDGVLTAEHEIDFGERGFAVYGSEDLPWHLQHKLAVKGHAPKQAHEWMALKIVWIKAHLNCNNEELPYVPHLTVVA